LPPLDGSRVAECELRFRLAYLDGAEEQWRERLGRGLTEDEVELVIRRFPSDQQDEISHAMRNPPKNNPRLNRTNVSSAAAPQPKAFNHITIVFMREHARGPESIS